MEKKAVPKFGSFKPKSAPKPATQDSQTHKKSRRSDEQDESARRRRHDDSRRRHHRDRQDDEPKLSRRRRSRESRAKTPDTDIPIATDEFEESNLYIVDRRGDAKNVEYGSLHRYSIPPYRRIGYGNVVGLSCSKKIDRNESNDKELCLRSTGQDRGYRMARPLTSKYGKSNESKLRFIVFNPDNTDSTESDYIDLRSSRKRKRGSHSPEAEATTVDYRSIEGKAKESSKGEDDDLEAASGSESEDVDLDLQTRQENAVLSKKAKATPTDMDAWLALVEHQAELVRPGLAPASFTSSERRTLADLRLSILNEAADHISKNKPNRDRLLRAIILEGSIIWDSAKRIGKWREAIAECPESILLWTEYLSYIQDSHAGFKYENCKDAYLQCLKMLKEVRAKGGIDHTSIGRIQIFVLLRLTALIRDAGYVELAIGLWQAVLEYHLHLPSRLASSPTSERLSAFEEYWESEVPRIGEKESRGWASYDADGETISRSPSNLDRMPLDPNRPYESFALQEMKLQSFVLPASTVDDDATLDPFRCVMFSDIEEVLELLSADLFKDALITGLLYFLDLPSLPAAGAVEWMRDPHIAGRQAAEIMTDDMVKLRCQRETTESLFDDAFDDFLRYSQGSKDNESGLAVFVGRTLEALVAISPEDDDIAEYCLAYKLHISPVDAGKFAKRLLKQRPSSLLLYNAYALIEAQRGNMEKAQTVWSTALSAKLTSAEQEHDVLLWHSRMIAQCRAGDEAAALRDLCAIADASPQGPNASEYEDGQQIRQLRSKRLLEEKLNSAILGGNSAYVHLIVDCLAWTEYLANDHDLNAALQLHRKRSSRFQRDGQSAVLELLHQCKARLLKMHIDNQRPFKPAVLRQELDEALELFPNNSMLLDLQTRIAAQDRLRSLVHEQKVSDPANMSIVQWSFRIAEELRRAGSEAFGSTRNTVRATFSKALLNTDSAVRHSPALWTMWLRFEHSRANQAEGSRKSDAFRMAKQVFLDGLRNIPWVKQWVILGMTLLAPVMNSGEMRQAYDVLVERGLRLRVDIEDLL